MYIYAYPHLYLHMCIVYACSLANSYVIAYYFRISAVIIKTVLLWCNFLGIVVITDGIVDVPDPNMLQSLLSHLRQNNITCSFIQLSNHFTYDNGLGQVPYPEILQFLASATFGAYFAKLPVVVSGMLICASTVTTYMRYLFRICELY